MIENFMYLSNENYVHRQFVICAFIASAWHEWQKVTQAIRL